MTREKKIQKVGEDAFIYAKALYSSEQLMSMWGLDVNSMDMDLVEDKRMTTSRGLPCE